jgi:hypothetical protein
MSETENKFYDLEQDTLDSITAILDNMAMPFNLKIKFIGNNKMKNLIKLQKMNDVMSHITNIDLLVFINEEYFINLQESNSEILIYQELDRLQFDLNKGTFKISKYPLQTTPGVLKKYGIDAVAEANQLSDLYTDQKKDSDITITIDDLKSAVKSVKKDVEFLN